MALIPLSLVVAVAAQNVSGVFGAIPPLVLLALIAAIVVRTGRALIAGLVVAVLCVLAYLVLDILGGALLLGHPDSFADFVPALMRAAGSVTATAALIVAVRQRSRGYFPPRHRLARRLTMTGAAALAAVAVLSGLLTYPGRARIDAPPGSLAVVTQDDVFDPSELRAEGGDRLRVFIKNVDSYAHTFTIDALAVDVYVGPYADRLVTVSIPDVERTYELYCAVTGHEAMDGALIVSG